MTYSHLPDTLPQPSFSPVRREKCDSLHASPELDPQTKFRFCTTRVDPRKAVAFAVANVCLERLQPSKQAIDMAHGVANRITTLDQAIAQLISIHGRHP